MLLRRYLVGTEAKPTRGPSPRLSRGAEAAPGAAEPALEADGPHDPRGGIAALRAGDLGRSTHDTTLTSSMRVIW